MIACNRISTSCSSNNSSRARNSSGDFTFGNIIAGGRAGPFHNRLQIRHAVRIACAVNPHHPFDPVIGLRLREERHRPFARYLLMPWSNRILEVDANDIRTCLQCFQEHFRLIARREDKAPPRLNFFSSFIVLLSGLQARLKYRERTGGTNPPAEFAMVKRLVRHITDVPPEVAAIGFKSGDPRISAELVCAPLKGEPPKRHYCKVVFGIGLSACERSSPTSPLTL